MNTPVADGEGKASSPTEKSPLALVLDDDAMNRRVAELLLKRLGCVVISTGDVPDAVARIREREFDYVFTDIEMPGTNGFEALGQLREADGLAHPGRARPLRVAALTAGEMDHRPEDYLADGFDACLVKPVMLADVHRLLERWRGQPG